MFDWNDLRYFLAVAQHGSTIAAARALGVDQTTVQRRLAALERALGQPLVKRHPSGYRLTEFGAGLRESAQHVQQAVTAFEQCVNAARHDAVGVVRVTCPEPIVLRLQQSGLIDRFHARHPGLQVEFVMSDRYLDLKKGEADVALRSGDTDDGELVGRKVGDSLWGLYASERYLREHGTPAGLDALAGHSVVALDESMAGHRANTWLRRVAPDASIAARCNSVLGLLQSAKAGLGLAPLPLPIGDAEPTLLRVAGPIDELTRIWRVLAAPEQRRTPRVAAFFDFVVAEVDALRPVLGG